MTTQLETLKSKVAGFYSKATTFAEADNEVNWLICSKDYEELAHKEKHQFLVWLSGFETAWCLAKSWEMTR